MGKQRSGKSKRIEPEGKPAVELTEEEIDLLVRILRKHRRTMPSYLLSMQTEVEIIDRLLEKLA